MIDIIRIKVVREVENTLKSELRRREMVAMGKIFEDLEDAAGKHNTRILFWHVIRC